MFKKIIFLLFTVSFVSFGSDLEKIFTELSKNYSDKLIMDEKEIFSSGHQSSMCSLGVGRNGEVFATGEPGVIHVWDTVKMEKIRDIKDNELYEPYRCIDFDSSGHLLAVGSLNNNIKIFNWNNGKLLKVIKGHTDTVTHVTFSSDGHYLASSSDDGSVRIWNVSTGEEIQCLDSHENYVKTVIFTMDGKYLISGGNDNKIRVWNVYSGEEKEVLDGGTCVYSLALSSNGRMLASGGNGIVKIWDTSTWEEISSYGSYDSYEGQVEDIAFTSNNKYLISGSQEGKIEFYDLRKNKVVKKIDGIRAVWSVRVISNLNKIISEDRYEIKIWELFDFLAKANTNTNANIYDDSDNIIGLLPKRTVVEINRGLTEISKPVNAKVNSEDFEIMYTNREDYSFYTAQDTTIYADSEKTRIFSSMEKGKIIKNLYYSYELNLMYIDDGKFIGWIEPENIGIIRKENNKLVVINNSTITYTSINGPMKSLCNSGEILESDYVELNRNIYYSESIGWINKEDVALINEKDQGKKVFVNKTEANLNFDFTGNNYKKVSMGKEYNIIGATDMFYLVEEKNTKEKGWLAKSDTSFNKPDLNEPLIMVTSTVIGENNMLKIEGKIYDDTDINSFSINGNKINIKPLSTFDKISYIPEVGYSFSAQWFLIEGMENTIELKVVDKVGKEYIKVLKYTPEYKKGNINEIRAENTTDFFN